MSGGADSAKTDRRGWASRRPIIAACLVVTTVLAAACSGGPASPRVANLGSTTTTTGSASSGGQPAGNPLATEEAYAVCMRKHGIKDFPDPTPGPGGHGAGFSITAGPGSDLDPNLPRFQAADQVCKKLLPGENLTPAQLAQVIAADVKLAQCMRSHGVSSWPDPDSQGAFELNGFSPASPQVRPALTTCRNLTHFQGPMRVQVNNPNGGG